MKNVNGVFCAVLLLLLAENAQAGMAVVPIPTKVPNMRCPSGEYVYGFSNGVPLCTNWTPRVVFVTSSTVIGAMGGLAAADVICQNEATAASLTGTYIAFLSNSVSPGSTIDRINMNPPTLKYVRPDGITVANDTAGFLSANHLAGINLTANGNAITGDTRVWTGYINTNGEITSQQSPSVNCSDWTDATPYTAGGANGVATATNASWFQDYGTYCTESHHLYCVQVLTGTVR